MMILGVASATIKGEEDEDKTKESEKTNSW